MGVVVPFPASRQRHRVRRLASSVSERCGFEATRYFRKACRSHFLQLTVAYGIRARVAQADVDAFKQAVQAEMIRQTYCVLSRGDSA